MISRRNRKTADQWRDFAKHGIQSGKSVVMEMGQIDGVVDLSQFRFSSDIDLAVMGGTIIGWKIAEQSPWKIDYVELEDQEQSMVDAITALGVVLYERS